MKPAERHGASFLPEHNKSACAGRLPHPILPPVGEGENESLRDFHSNAHILTINGGSSSIKFALFDGALRRILQGAIERIGLPEASLRVQGLTPQDNFSRPVTAPDHTAAVAVLMDWIEERGDALAAIGHRMVHGGPKYSQPERITAKMVEALHQLSPFDPEHLPEEILLTEAFHRRYPDMPQVACFDTAFHHDMPRVAQVLPIPRRYEAEGLRRYGFHGLSYAYLMEELARLGDTAASKGRVILAHLGNGASLAAVQDGKPIDTSMGFTPAAGVLMSTRSGDLDPGVAGYLMKNMTPEQFSHLVNHESGLLGVSQSSSDMRDLLAQESTDVRAAEAVALFCYQIKKCIGAYAAALGGLDALVFAGGIGENAPVVRARICAGLEFLGVVIDEKQNAANADVISASSGRITVRVMHTDEEVMIAKAVCHVLDIQIEQDNAHDYD